MSHPFSLSKREIPPHDDSTRVLARQFKLNPNRFGYAAREFIGNYRGRLHEYPGDISLGI